MCYLCESGDGSGEGRASLLETVLEKEGGFETSEANSTAREVEAGGMAEGESVGGAITGTIGIEAANACCKLGGEKSEAVREVDGIGVVDVVAVGTDTVFDPTTAGDDIVLRSG